MNIHPDIIYVDENDNVIGAGPRKEAYEKGIIHRIVRIIISRPNGDVLIQKRGQNILLAGKWDQSAAGHVDKGETYEQAAYRETEEEIGIKDIHLIELAHYYSVETDEVVRKRFNILYSGIYSGEIETNPDEVSDYRWIKQEELKKWIAAKPEDFTNGCRDAFKIYFAAHD
jgi:16S rRNA (adenine1518-N6/adenine1519-N6)-dimethyltransferase